MTEEVDYRYSLTNERTYLAWVRTGGTDAGGIAIRMLHHRRWCFPRCCRCRPSASPSWVAFSPSRRTCTGRDVQRRMEQGEPLPTQRGPLILTIGMVVLTVIVIAGSL